MLGTRAQGKTGLFFEQDWIFISQGEKSSLAPALEDVTKLDVRVVRRRLLAVRLGQARAIGTAFAATAAGTDRATITIHCGPEKSVVHASPTSA